MMKCELCYYNHHYFSNAELKTGKSLYLSLSLCLSVCFCFCLCLSLFLSLSLSQQFRKANKTDSSCLWLSVSLTLCLSVSVSLSVSNTLTFYDSVSLSLPSCLFLCLSSLRRASIKVYVLNTRIRACWYVLQQNIVCASVHSTGDRDEGGETEEPKSVT